jgi:endogenous inhibitor of DNA gyrase (YacG/DUF329 family)
MKTQPEPIEITAVMEHHGAGQLSKPKAEALATALAPLVEQMRAAVPEAQWNISLCVDCPHCGEFVDLTDHDDFWDGRPFTPCENGTDRTTDVEVECPECGETFACDFTY